MAYSIRFTRRSRAVLLYCILDWRTSRPFTYLLLMLLGSGRGFVLAGYGTSVELFPSVQTFSLPYISVPHGNASQVLGKATTSQRGLLISHVATFLQLALLCSYQRRSLAGFRPRLGLFILDRYLVHQDFQPFLAKRRRFLECLEDGRVYIRRPQEGLRGIITEMGYKIIRRSRASF